MLFLQGLHLGRHAHDLLVAALNLKAELIELRTKRGDGEIWSLDIVSTRAHTLNKRGGNASVVDGTKYIV